jgi:hypothetical protein
VNDFDTRTGLGVSVARATASRFHDYVALHAAMACAVVEVLTRGREGVGERLSLTQEARFKAAI